MMFAPSHIYCLRWLRWVPLQGGKTSLLGCVISKGDVEDVRSLLARSEFDVNLPDQKVSFQLGFSAQQGLNGVEQNEQTTLPIAVFSAWCESDTYICLWPMRAIVPSWQTQHHNRKIRKMPISYKKFRLNEFLFCKFGAKSYSRALTKRATSSCIADGCVIVVLSYTTRMRVGGAGVVEARRGGGQPSGQGDTAGHAHTIQLCVLVRVSRNGCIREPKHACPFCARVPYFACLSLFCEYGNF